jgi:hypothetical protein
MELLLKSIPDVSASIVQQLTDLKTQLSSAIVGLHEFILDIYSSLFFSSSAYLQRDFSLKFGTRLSCQSTETSVISSLELLQLNQSLKSLIVMFDTFKKTIVANGIKYHFDWTTMDDIANKVM